MKLNIKYFSAWLILSIIIWYFLGTFDNITSEKVTTDNNSSIVKVERGTIKESTEVVGDAELVDEQSLTFNKVWTVTNVYFSEWDAVQKWDIIAKLDDSDAYRSIEDAKLSLKNAQINLAQLYEDEDDSKIKQAENSITTYENSYDILNKELENLKITQENSILKLENEISNYKIEIDNTKTEKENSLTSKESSKNTTIIKIEDNFKDYLIDIKDIIESADTILGVSQERKSDNDDYDQYLWAKNTTVKNQSKINLIESIWLYEALLEDMQTYTYNGQKNEIILLLNDFLVVYNNLYNTTDLLYEVIDSSIASVWSLSENDISSMKQSISQARTESLSKIDAINSDINSLNSLIDTDLEFSSSELTIQKMETNLEQLIKDFETTKTKFQIELNSKITDIENKKENLEIAKINLEELLEWPTDSNIQKSNNSIAQSQLKLTAAYEDLEDYILTAPFDWVIRKSDYLPWDNLKDDNNKYVYIENPNLLEVNVMLDQIDIVNIELWGMAIVTFDSYASFPVNAKISNIDTTPVKSSWVVSYEVKIILDDPSFDKKVLSWMTADVEIINELKEDILLLKTSAITTIWDKKTVIVNKNWTQEQIEIEVWISWDGSTEIISWLKLWDQIIVWEFNIGTQEEEATTLFETPTWWTGQWKGQGTRPTR